MTERQKLILFAVVKEYIKNGQPISSMLISEKYNFSISPATFRNEFSDLEDMGFLYHPYTSSGRIPTDKGYRLFVNSLLEKRTQEKEKMRKIFLEFAKVKREHDDMFAELTRSFSEFSRNVVFSGLVDSKMLFRSGINEVLSQPEFDDSSLRGHFGSVIDSFEEHLPEIMSSLSENEFAVLIGKENPFSDAKDFSMIVSKFNFDGNESVIAILGPKRMDYAKNINLINSLIRLLK
jgi:heat-inducible transcriptional repressor